MFLFQPSCVLKKSTGVGDFTTACNRFSSNGGLSIFGIIILALDVLALIDVFRQPWTIGKKILWIAIIWFLPILGLILYYLLAGRGNSNTGVV